MTKKMSKDERIEDITNAAIDVFLEKGYQNTTMEAIAKKAGISKGGLYHHFPSKDIILLKVNQRIGENVEEIMKNAGEYSSVKEGLTYFITNYLLYWIEHPRETSFLFTTIAKILETPELYGYYHDLTSEYLKYIEETFALGIELGEFKPHNPKTSAITLVSSLDGVLSYIFLDEKLDVEMIIEQFINKFVNDLDAQKVR